MDAATLYTVLTIVGSFIIIILSVTAFLLKSILKDTSELKLVFTELNIEHGLYVDTVKAHERKIETLTNKYDKELEKCRNRLHSLEGASLQVLEFIKETTRK